MNNMKVQVDELCMAIVVSVDQKPTEAMDSDELREAVNALIEDFSGSDAKLMGLLRLVATEYGEVEIDEEPCESCGHTRTCYTLDI